MLLPNSIYIWREENGDYCIDWKTEWENTEVSIKSTDESLSINPDFIHDSSYKARISGLPRDKRHFFHLTDQHGNCVLASERRINMQGSPNFRDFGGYYTTNGQQVKWGHLFRSGHLAHLNPDDIHQLDQLQLNLIFDLRKKTEQDDQQNKLPEYRRPLVHSLPITSGNHIDFNNIINAPTATQLMVDISRELAAGQMATYATLLKEILATENARFLIHCTAGKDRTGFGAALILLALGVSEEVVIEDYLLTSKFFIPAQQVTVFQKRYLFNSEQEAILPIFQAHKSYIKAALDTVKKQFGSITGYLHEGLGLSTQELHALRTRYLY